MPSDSLTNLPDWLPVLSYEVLASAASLLTDTEWLLVGALARDYAFRDSDDLKTLRATTDVDLAALLESWEEFAAKMDMLCDSGRFSRTEMPHRLRHANGQLMDFVPFGGMESDHHIAWPPDGEPKMNVTAFKDVLSASETVKLSGGVNVRIATPASVGLLKLIAWRDNPSRRERDIEDIAAFIKGYITEILGWDEAYQKYEPTLAAEDFDLDEAGAYVLGDQMAHVLSPESYKRVMRTVGRLEDDDRLAATMQAHFSHSFEQVQRICQRLASGFSNRYER